MREQSEVKKGIGVPRRTVHYDWSKLKEVGDSFFIPKEVGRSVRAAASFEGKASGRRYATRTITDGVDWGYEGVSGVAVWLLE